MVSSQSHTGVKNLCRWSCGLEINLSLIEELHKLLCLIQDKYFDHFKSMTCRHFSQDENKNLFMKAFYCGAQVIDFTMQKQLFTK